MGRNSGRKRGSQTKVKKLKRSCSGRNVQGACGLNREDYVREVTEEVKEAEGKQPGERDKRYRKERGELAHNPVEISHARKSWTEDEHDLFLEALARYGRNWKCIQNYIGSKTVIQIRSHAQKYFLKMEKTGKAQQVPPPRPKRKSTRAQAKSQENSNKILCPGKEPQLEMQDRAGKGQLVASTNREMGKVKRVTNGTWATDTGPSESATFPLAESFGSTGDPKSTQLPGNAKRTDKRIAGKPRLHDQTGTPYIIHRAKLGNEPDKFAASTSIHSAATRSQSLVVNDGNASRTAVKTAEACDIENDQDRRPHDTAKDAGNHRNVEHAKELNLRVSASKSTTISIRGLASGAPAAAASPPTSGSAPDGSNGSAATSGCGSKTADPQMSDDAEPSGGSGGSAELSKRSGDSAGHTSNSTGKSETADDTATTVRACTWANNTITATLLEKSTLPPDPSCVKTDNGIGGDSNGGNSEAQKKRRGRRWQGNSGRPQGTQPEWQAVSQHNLVFTLDPRSSGNAEDRDGGSSEGTHEPDHQKRQKRSASHYNSTCSGYLGEHRKDHDQTCRLLLGSDNNDEDSTGSEGTNDQQGQSQTEHQLRVRQSPNRGGLKDFKMSYTQDQHGTYVEARSLQWSEADAPTGCYPTTPFAQKRPRLLNTATCSNTNNQILERVEHKGDMDAGSADDDSLGGITGLSLSFSNNMLMDDDSGQIETGTVLHHHIPRPQAESIDVGQGETATGVSPLWTMNSNAHHPMHPIDSVQYTQPQQTQFLNSQTCAHQNMPYGNAEIRLYNQTPQVRGSNFLVDTPNLLQEHGAPSSVTGWMNTNNLDTHGAGRNTVEVNSGSTWSDANFIEVYRMLATHCDPTAEDKQLQQEIGHLHPMEQRTFDVLMGNMCRAFMSQAGRGDPLLLRNDVNFQESILPQSTIPNQYQQCLGGELPISFTIAQSQVTNGGLSLQGPMPRDPYDPELTVTFDINSMTQCQNIT